MKTATLKASDVYVSEADDIYPEGTPAIRINGMAYNIPEISTALLLDEEQRGFPRSLCLGAMQLLAARAAELAKETERREGEERRLKKQAERFVPLICDVLPFLDNFGGMMAEIVVEGDVWVSFTQETISFTCPLGKDMSKYIELFNQKGIGLKAFAKPVEEGDRNRIGLVGWAPSVVKASGTRTKGTAILIDGMHRLNSGKAVAGYDGRFFVKNGRVHVDSPGGNRYMSGVEFLTDMTTETGKPEARRPWGHPAKTIAAISVFVEDVSDAFSAAKLESSKAELEAMVEKLKENAPEEGK